ncbi:nucleotide exchange factor SIL1 isoform X2 [Chelonus insularis]|uniref:nucleotide exchange factor SIL1 isoform X2 n=1 Tax=Chelonus insularis TaxID=460826 RepID=UPI00158D7378|nr:nucleotide exchange factor SIL1 isoform X2 [Chelonus insularis]
MLCIVFVTSIYLRLRCFYHLLVYADKNESEFVPTHEWQSVKKGQPIPKGLHVRHNFQTGLTEAKLLDKDDKVEEKADDQKQKSLTLHSEASVDNENDLQSDNMPSVNRIKLSLENLKARLKKIKFETNEVSQNEKNPEDVKKKFRSYNDLREEFKALEMNITTDSEIILNLFERFQPYTKALTSGTLQNSQIENIMQIFNDLEFLLHQIDNAQLFADLGGMSIIISPCLNTTNDNVKIEALRILGTAVQSNPNVQSKALNNDLIPKVLHLLTTSNKATLRSRCLFALSALLRQFPTSQKVFIDHGGLEIFGKILENGQLQTQLRIMQLITDLAIERENINKTEDERLRLMKIREYRKTNFEEKLIEHKYCKYLASILRQNFQQNIAVNSLMEISDFFEVIMDNMLALSSTCKSEYRKEENGLFLVLNEIRDYYDKMKAAELIKEVEMFKHILEKISSLQKLTFDSDTHDEL